MRMILTEEFRKRVLDGLEDFGKDAKLNIRVAEAHVKRKGFGKARVVIALEIYLSTHDDVVIWRFPEPITLEDGGTLALSGLSWPIKHEFNLEGDL